MTKSANISNSVNIRFIAFCSGLGFEPCDRTINELVELDFDGGTLLRQGHLKGAMKTQVEVSRKNATQRI